jgi:hypothetical protein
MEDECTMTSGKSVSSVPYFLMMFSENMILFTIETINPIMTTMTNHLPFMISYLTRSMEEMTEIRSGEKIQVTDVNHLFTTTPLP